MRLFSFQEDWVSEASGLGIVSYVVVCRGRLLECDYFRNSGNLKCRNFPDAVNWVVVPTGEEVEDDVLHI